MTEAADDLLSLRAALIESWRVCASDPLLCSLAPSYLRMIRTVERMHVLAGGRPLRFDPASLSQSERHYKRP